MGGIDIDPASCEEANRTVGADRYFTVEEDGLGQEWRGRVWLNPPFGYRDTREFVSKLLKSYDEGWVTQACCLVMQTPDSRSTARLHSRFPHCMPPLQVWFNRPGAERGRLRDPVMIYYLGPNTEAFAEHFSPIGAICAPVVPYRGVNPVLPEVCND